MALQDGTPLDFLSGSPVPGPNPQGVPNPPEAPNHDGTWTDQQERILAGWCEKAAGYRWMHDKAAKYFKKQNTWLTLPVIAISTMTGSANFLIAGAAGAEDGHIDEPPVLPMVIGAMNLGVAVIGALNQFLRLAENAENHKVAGVAFGSFSRHISCELSIPRSDRDVAQEFVNNCKKEFDRMIENAPDIPDDIVEKFCKMIKDTGGEGVSLPDIANGISKVEIYRDTTNSCIPCLGKNHSFQELKENA
tara:strand:+ start:425 stop:1168 length:744 start_codon:yes stop_codon:yes gene_type:complete